MAFQQTFVSVLLLANSSSTLIEVWLSNLSRHDAILLQGATASSPADDAGHFAAERSVLLFDDCALAHSSSIKGIGAVWHVSA